MDLVTLGLVLLAAIIVVVLVTHKPKKVAVAPVVEDVKVSAVNSITVAEIAAKAEVISKPAKPKAAPAKKAPAKKPAAIKAPAKKAPAKKPAASKAKKSSK